MRNNLFWRKQMYDSGAGSGGGNSRYYWRDGKKYSIMNDPMYGHLMPDGTPDTRWQTAPIRIGHRVNDALIDGAIGVMEGGRKVRDTYNAAEGWLDDRYEDVVDFFDRDRYASSGPLARHGYRHHPGGYAIPANAVLTPEAQAFRDRPALGSPHTQVTIDNTPSHLIPGFDRMVNEGYDSWSPSDADNYNNREYNIMRHGVDYPVDNRSDWQKWKDSVNSGRR